MTQTDSLLAALSRSAARTHAQLVHADSDEKRTEILSDCVTDFALIARQGREINWPFIKAMGFLLRGFKHDYCIEHEGDPEKTLKETVCS